MRFAKYLAAALLAAVASSSAFAANPKSVEKKAVPGAGSAWQESVVDGNGHTIPQFNCDSVAGTCVVVPLAYNSTTISRQPTTDGNQVVGFFASITNQGPANGYGDRFACFSNANSAGFDICRSALMFDRTPSVTGATAFMSQWLVHVSPPDTTHSWSATVGEINITNRGADQGWQPDLTVPSQLTGGLRFVPETQTFGEPGNRAASNVDYGWSCSHSPFTNLTGAFAGKYAKTYGCFMAEQNSIAPGGRAFYAGGDTSGVTGDYPYSPLQADKNFVTGIDVSQASFLNAIALYMNPNQIVEWYPGSGGAAAAFQGSCIGSVCNMNVRADSGALVPSGTVDLGSASAPWSHLYLSNPLSPAQGGTGNTGGAWTPFVPANTFTNGNSPAAADAGSAYQQIGKTIKFRISEQINCSASTPPTVFTIALPVGTANGAQPFQGINLNTGTIFPAYTNATSSITVSNPLNAVCGQYITVGGTVEIQ